MSPVSSISIQSRLLYCYSSCSLPKHLDFSLLPDLSFATFHRSILALLHDEHLNHYPPSSEYQKTWWKWALTQLETSLKSGHIDPEEDEIDSQIYERYTSLLDSSQRSGSYPAGLSGTSAVPQPSYLTYFIPRDETSGSSTPALRLTMMESRTVIEGGTTGLRTWPASLVLAEYLLAHPDTVRDRCVLELGSGVGFLGAVIACMHNESPSGRLYLTDINAHVLERCQDNIRLRCNASHANENVHIHELDWFDATSDSTNVTPSQSFIKRIAPDTIIGADIVYDPLIIPALVGTIKRCLTPSCTDSSPRQAFIAVTIRNEDTVSLFKNMAREKLTLEEMSWTRPSFLERQLGMCDHSNVEIIKITLSA